MPATRKTNKFFARGAGCATRYTDSDVVLFTWHGRTDGHARYMPHVKRYTRNGIEHASLAALLRAVEAEHAN